MSLRSRFIGAMQRAYDPEGTEKKPIVFRSIGVMQRSQNMGSASCMV
ncbi:MAG: hypothetical protein ACQEQO_03340 [Thermodesulfobacteriota bacterium]